MHVHVLAVLIALHGCPAGTVLVLVFAQTLHHYAKGQNFEYETRHFSSLTLYFFYVERAAVRHSSRFLDAFSSKDCTSHQMIGK